MESPAVADPIIVSPESLAAAFDRVPEPRRAASVVSPLAAILALTVAALLANHTSGLAIAEWGAPSGIAAGRARVARPANRRCTVSFGSSTGTPWR